MRPSRRRSGNSFHEEVENNLKNNEELLNSIENKALVGHSGNSKVDVTVNIETTAIAYAMLCAMHSTGAIDKNQFRESVRKLSSLMGKKPSGYRWGDD